MITPEQLQILQHSLGVDQCGQGDQFRNHFVTGSDSVVALAELMDCVQIERVHAGAYDRHFPWLRDHEHATGPWCWVLKCVRPLANPVLWKGAQGLWQLELPEVQCG